tara:strand:+ start:849 stop:1487 length:639 start_codon:yes stop_codon:yes gene_type:complete
MEINFKGDKIKMELKAKYSELGLGIQRYDENDIDTCNPKNSLNSFNLEIWPRIQKYFLKDKEVLDIGSGNGRFAAFFSLRVKKVVAIDPCREPNIHFKRQNLVFYKESLQSFNIENNYDIVYLHGVFYLQQNWGTSEAFRKIVSKTKPNGYIIIVDDKKRDVNSDSPAVGEYNTKLLCMENNVQIVDSFIQENNEFKIIVIKNTQEEQNEIG